MEDILGKITSAIIAIVVILFVPVMLISIKTEEAVQSYVQAKAVQFVDESRTSGYVSPENYLTFINSITATGHYEVELEHRAKVAYPDESSGDHDYKIGYHAYYRDEILSAMFDSGSDEDYLMHNGDYLTITVTSTGNSITNAFSRLFAGTGSGGVAVSYGGYVGNSGGSL